MATRSDLIPRAGVFDWITDVLLRNRYVLFIEAIVVFFIAWWLVSYVFGLQDLLSSPVLVGNRAYELFQTGEWIPHFVASFKRIVLGFAVTMIIGVGVGIVMGVAGFWKQVLEYYILIGLALPSIFASIFAAMWFGLSDVTPAVATLLVTFPFVSVAVYESIENMDRGLFQMSTSFDVSRARFIRRVIVQSIMPEIFGGARFAFSVAWKVTTLTEVIISNVGVGAVIRTYVNILDMTSLVTYVLIFTVIILIIEYGVFRQLEKRVFAWRQGETITYGM